MTRKIFSGLALAGTLFFTFCLAGSGNALRNGISSIRRIVIDGKSFVSDDSPPDAGSHFKREIDKLGVLLPDGFDSEGEPDMSNPAFSGRLKESFPQRSVGATILPAGLIAEHTLRMEGEATPVDLVFGTLGTTGPSIRSHLLTSGWKSLSVGKDPGGMHVLQLTRGKETSIVFLYDADRTFLFCGEVGR